MKIWANHLLKRFPPSWCTVKQITRHYLHQFSPNSTLRSSRTNGTITLPRHLELKKFIHPKSLDSLAEAIEFHETALDKGTDIKCFFTSDKKTLEAATAILDRNPDQQFLTELLLSPPSSSRNEQCSRVIIFSPIENFPQYLPEYEEHKDQTSLLSVGGPAALDTALLASLMKKNKLSRNIHISGPFCESNLAYSALQLHVRHGTALNAESALTGHALLLSILVRNIIGCSIEEILHPDFRKIDLKFSSLTPKKLRIYLGNEFNWLWQAVRHLSGFMTEHDLNRLESAFSQDILHMIENVTGVALSSNAYKDPMQSISIHVDLTKIGSEETNANNTLIKETVGIDSEYLTDDEKDFFFGMQKVNIVQATRYPNDGSLLLQAQCMAQNIIMNYDGQCLQQHITHILFAEDENDTRKARLAGVVTEGGQFIYASHLHLSPGYKAKFQFGEAKNSTLCRNLLNRMKNRLDIDPPVPGHRLTVATGVSVNALMRNTPHLKKIIDSYGTTPLFAVTNSHWTMLAKNETHILMRITGGGNTGMEDYNPAYFLNLVANTERIFGPEALIGIISTYGCPRSINARNSTEFFKAANVLISYGKGGTGNTKRHAEAILALLELGLTNIVLALSEQHAVSTAKPLAVVASSLHRKAKAMGFFVEDNAHFNRRLGYSNKLSYNEKFGVTVFFLGFIISIGAALSTGKNPNSNITTCKIEI